jgi:hypothetical protein
MVKAHKGNRSERVSGFRFTPAEKADLMTVLKARNMSLADWVGEQVRREIAMFQKNSASSAAKKAAYEHGIRGDFLWEPWGDGGMRVFDNKSKTVVLTAEELKCYEGVKWSDIK